MAKTKSVEAFRDDTLQLEARIIEAIRKEGPQNVSKLSRMLGAHQETVRYKIKSQFRRLGFRIHADVDYRKLGLSLHWATFKFSPGFLGSANRILAALNETGYLTYYARIIPQGYYIALFAVPTGAGSEYRKFLDHLKRIGMVENFTFKEALASRHNSMNPRYFNFRSGMWEVDWNRVRADPARPLVVEPRKPVATVDKYDLLIIKELQKDALQHLVEVGRRLKVNQKTLEYHNRTHVQKEKLIPNYNVRWTRDMESSVSHSVQLARLTASGLTTKEFIRLQAAVSKIPFLWAEELLKDGTYIATLLIPAQEAVTTFDYLSNEAPNLDTKVSVGYINVRDACLFTIPYHKFEEGWSVDQKALVSDFNRAMTSREKPEASTP